MLSKSLITLYINICKITKLILVTQHTYKYANVYIYICKLNAIGYQLALPSLIPYNLLKLLAPLK